MQVLAGKTQLCLISDESFVKQLIDHYNRHIERRLWFFCAIALLCVGIED